MPTSTLTKRIEFSASHRYHNSAWDSATNRVVFGPCNNEPSHGHNYLLELTVRGKVDPVTGMIINLYDLKRILTQVIEEFDHKHLNLDTPYFETIIPTTENLACVLWHKFLEQPDIQELGTLRLHEGDNLYAEVSAGFAGFHSTAPPTEIVHTEARITRLYPLPIVSAASMGRQRGHAFILEVTIRGPIDQQTGRVTDIVALDDLVGVRILTRFKDNDVMEDQAFHTQSFSNERFAELIWNLLQPAVQEGSLEKIRLRDFDGGQVAYGLW